MKAIAQRAPSILGFSETRTHHLIRFDMHKILRSDIRVEFKREELVVQGRDRWEDEEAEGVSLRVESDRPGVFARYRAGVLLVAVPKRAVEQSWLAVSA